MIVLVLVALGCSEPVIPVDAASVDAAVGIDAPRVDAGPPHCPGPFSAPDAAELAVRRSLGIPDEAGCVVVLSQTSHIDIDWRSTFDEYYASYVDHIFTSARDLLNGDDAYRYQVCEMAYLQNHLATHPEQLADFQAASTRGALRIVGGAMTSPDTLLPTTEALVRDHLRGSLFAEGTLGASARDAWLPDSFGHSPTTPDLLAGMGYEGVAFARVDGLHDDIELHYGSPRIVPGSTADVLTTMGTADFVWRGPAGGEVLAHWLPWRLYCQGDNLDHTGTPLPGGFALGQDRSDDPAYVNLQIEGYVREMTPLVRTPYLFVPVGCDFASPHVHLLDHIRRWNTEMYPGTGIYVVASSFEEYVDLLAERHADLPTLSPDMSDYFSGYFASRLALKQQIRGAGDALVQAEVLALLAERVAAAPYPSDALGHAWDSFARTDHHDFIAGTSADEVVTNEQTALVTTIDGIAAGVATTALGQIARGVAPDSSGVASLVVLGTVGAARPAQATATVVLDPGVAHDLAADGPSQVLSSTRHPDGSLATAEVLVTIDALRPASARSIALHDRAATGPVSLTDDGTHVVMTDTSRGLRATIDRVSGLLSSLTLGGVEQLAAPSLGLEHWHDEGGLYRIGSETNGCHFDDLGALGGAVSVDVVESGPARARVHVVRGDASLELRLVAGLGRLDLDLSVSAATGESVTLELHTIAAGARARFVHGGGTIERPAMSLFAPSFWPVVRALDLARDDGSGFALLPRFSTGAAWSSDGSLSVLVARNAPAEHCDILGEDGTEIVHAALALALEPHASAIDPLAEAMALLDAPAAQIGMGTQALPISLVDLGGSGWVLSALKHAERGPGVVLRVERTTSTGTLTWAPSLLGVTSAMRTDLLERDGALVTSPLALDAALVTLRLTP